MKNNMILAAVAAASALLLSVSCAKTEQAEVAVEGKTFTAVIEQDITRTTLTNELNVNWKSGDRISINGEEYTAIPTEPATMAYFQPVEKDAVADSKAGYTAIYPASLESEDGSWWLPQEQKYEAGCFNAPMFAQSNTQKLYFKNICGVLKLSITGNYEVNEITVRANGENVWGTFGIFDNKMELYGGGDNVVVLDCGKDGVQLNSNEATDFFIYLPPQHYAQGMTISLLTSDGSEFDKTIVKDIDIYRNTLYPIEWNLLPSVEEALSKFFADFATDQANLTATTDEAVKRDSKRQTKDGQRYEMPTIHTWENAYSAIAALDNELNILDATGFQSDEDRIQYGKLLFFRAYMYFEIFRTYGKGHICTLDPNNVFSAGELATFIEENLKKALELLPYRYEEGKQVFELENGIAVTSPTRFAAMALLARTYQYWSSPLFGGEKSMLNTIIDYCQDIINNGGYNLSENYSDLWGANAFDNKELIFGVRFQNNDAYRNIHPLQSLIDKYDCGGEIFSKSFSGDNVPFPKEYLNYFESRFLYPIEGSHFTLGKDVAHTLPVFRLGGILLDCTEAILQTGNVAMASSYINNIRARAKLSQYSGVTMEQVENERYVELAFEGYRFWDVRRWMKAPQYFVQICDSYIEDVVDNYTLYRQPTERPWNDSYYFFPIPGSTDIDVIK